MPARDQKLQAISRFRVEARETGTCLVTGTDRRIEFPLRPAGVTLHVSGKVTYAGRAISPEPIGNSRWLIIANPCISIGAAGSEGFRSPLADDCMFVVDGARLAHVPLDEMRLVPLDELDQPILGAVQPPAPAGDTNEPFAGARLAHIPSEDELWPESVELIVGMPEPHFTALFDACVAQSIHEVSVHIVAHAHSTAAFYETPRDLILFANELVVGSVHYVGAGSRLGPVETAEPHDRELSS